MRETLERLILLQIGAAAATRERIEERVSSLVEQGRLEREEGRKLVEDILSRARERSGGLRSLLEASLQQGLRGAGLPNRGDYEDLLFRMEQLEYRVRTLEKAAAENPPQDASPASGEHAWKTCRRSSAWKLYLEAANASLIASGRRC